MFSSKHIKGIVASVLGVSLAISGSSVLAGSKDNSSADKVLKVDVGSGSGEIAYSSDEELEDIELRGPKSFAVSGSGEFFILDTIGHQIEVYDQNGNSERTIDLPEDKEFFDVEIDEDNNIYVLSDLGHVLQFENGKLENEFQVPVNQKRFEISGLFFNRDNEIVVRLLDDTELSLNKGKRSLKEEPTFEVKSIDDNTVELVTSDQKVEVSYDHVPVETALLKSTEEGEQLIVEKEAVIGEGLYVETRVGRYQDGEQIGTALAIPTKDTYFTSIPFKFLYVTKEGKAYQMITKKNSVEIYELPFTEEKKTNIDKQLLKKIQPEDKHNIVFFDEEKVEIRSSKAKAQVNDWYTALQRAEEMTYISWDYNPKKMKTSSTKNTTPPDHLAKVTKTVEEQGIPYNWGGYDGVDTSNSSGDNFKDSISNGDTAGNVNTNLDYRSSGTAGIDCSGFISSAYELGDKYGTSNLTKKFKKTSWYDFQAGDIGLRKGHVWMLESVKKGTDNPKGFYTYEATTDGTGDKAKSYYRSWDDAQSYTPHTIKE
ncbi:hypothetical protein HPY27_10980 [Brevibacillus sp. HB1.1]|uniref:hypothetical protein n=1 Tax=Brevibacillus sp. HB1.1 TaxID=2738808 RepID=UPI0015754036|nr:hypothetical protein [Brevibacillus sp. HB1.1]NTU30666.1 hypothetical protein [Brevibacillus sp. HB1.1]